MQIKSCRISVSSSYSDLSFLFHLLVALVHCKVCSKFEKNRRFRRCTPESSHGTIWNPKIGGLNCKCFPFSTGVFSSSMLVFGGVRPLLPPSIASYDSCHPFGARFSGHDSWALPGSIWQWLNHNRNLKLDVWFEELSCQGPQRHTFWNVSALWHFLIVQCWLNKKKKKLYEIHHINFELWSLFRRCWGNDMLIQIFRCKNMERSQWTDCALCKSIRMRKAGFAEGGWWVPDEGPAISGKKVVNMSCWRKGETPEIRIEKQ